MKKAVLALAAFVLLGAPANAQDIDVRALAAKLAAQEAMLGDLEAKMAYQACEGDKVIADEITSLRKNAAVTIGGLVTTGYYAGWGKAERRDGQVFGDPAENTHTKAKYRSNSLEMSDAELYADIQVNDHFEAFLSMDLHNVDDDDSAQHFGLAKSYYIRWKNICETGFGLKIGRDDAAFGDSENQAGYLDSFVASSGDGMGRFGIPEIDDDLMPSYNGWKYEGITQFTPYWENCDGSLSVELSLFQNAWNSDGYMNGVTGGVTSSYFDKRDGTRRYHSRNLGLGSGSFRVQYSPIEDLTFTAGVINFRSKNFIDEDGRSALANEDGARHASNNTAVNLAFRYTPCFFDKLTVWSQYVHGWNVDNIKNYDSDVVNAGFSLAFTDAVSFFAQGDYLKTRYKDLGVNIRTTGWAFYTGLTYELPVGAVLEAGWRHEYIKHKNTDGRVYKTARGDTLYANLGFEF